MGRGHGPDRLAPDETPLLPGEVADTRALDDVEHWVAVYEELTRFLVSSDLTSGTPERYRSRLKFWRCRRDELLGSAAPIPFHEASE